MDKIRVISSEKDGADLRCEKAKDRHYTRCSGKSDDNEINEALQSLGASKYFFDSQSWERIFGGKP